MELIFAESECSFPEASRTIFVLVYLIQYLVLTLNGASAAENLARSFECYLKSLQLLRYHNTLVQFT